MRNKAESSPAFLDDFEFVERGEPATKILSTLLNEGYAHCLKLVGPPITVGTLSYEWRLMGTWLFFKEQFLFDELSSRQYADIPVYAGTKAYDNMSSLRRSPIFARLTQGELKEFVDFFELRPEKWRETREFVQ